MGTIKHQFISSKTDSTDSTVVNPSNWNAVHTLSTPSGIAPGSQGVLLGTDSGGALTIQGVNATAPSQYLRLNAAGSAYEFGALPTTPPPPAGRTIPLVFNTDYNYAAQTPGVNLAVGSATIPMNPLPPGIIAGSYILITGGVGTSEAAPVTGVSGNNIIATLTYAHSGTYTVQSATGGIQEAINTLPTAGYGGGCVIIPNGSWNIYAPINITKSFVHLMGQGQVGTTLVAQFGWTNLINYTSVDQCGLYNLYLLGPGGGTPYAIYTTTLSNSTFRNITINNFYNGISLLGTSQGINGTKIFMNGIKGNGVFINTPVNGGTWFDTIIYGDSVNTNSAGWHITQTVGLNISHCYVNGCAYAYLIDPVAGAPVSVVEAFNPYGDGYAANSQTGVMLSPNGGVISVINFHGGGFGGYVNAGIYFQGTGTIIDCIFDGLYVAANGSTGISVPYVSSVTVKNIFFTNCMVENNSHTNPGTTSGLLLQNGTNVQVRGGVYAAGSYGGGGNTQAFGISVAGGTTNHSVIGAIVTPNMDGGIQLSGTNTGLVIKDCPGYNPVGTFSITPGPSPFTYYAGPSPESVYIQGGTLSSVYLQGGMLIANSAAPTGQSIIVPLGPGDNIQITYTVAPTMFKRIF